MTRGGPFNIAEGWRGAWGEDGGGPPIVAEGKGDGVRRARRANDGSSS